MPTTRARLHELLDALPDDRLDDVEAAIGDSRLVRVTGGDAPVPLTDRPVELSDARARASEISERYDGDPERPAEVLG